MDEYKFGGGGGGRWGGGRGSLMEWMNLLMGGTPPVATVGKTLSICNSLAHFCPPIPHLYGRERGYPHLNPHTKLYYVITKVCFRRKTTLWWIAIEP